MKMLYPYRIAKEISAPAPNPLAMPEETGRLLAELVYAVGQTFDIDPVVLPAGGSTLLLLYRDTVFCWQDVTEPFGDAIAAISQRWPLTLYGTAESRETVEVTETLQDKKLLTRLRSVSGEAFDALECLCLKIKFDSEETSGHMASLLRHMSCRNRCAAVGRKHDAFLQMWRLNMDTEGSMFSYVDLDHAKAQDCLFSLSAQQKARLWRTFLEENVQPKEFDWLWTAYQNGTACHLLEWELTLRSVLEELNFHVSHEEGLFQVTDETGNRRQFDLIHGGPAEKMFLKLLFPVDRRL